MEELQAFSLSATCIESREMSAIINLKVNKTDRNDARLIANAMRCNLYREVHHKSKESIEIGLQMRTRRTLIDTRTKLKNSIRGFLKVYGIRLGTVSHQKFPEAVRSVIKSCDVSIKMSFEQLLTPYEEVCKSIERADESLEALCKKDPLIELFEGIPGVGTITALTFKATIDDPYRFTNPRDIGAYLGLTPKQYSSGETVRQGGISRCGFSELRSLLVECGIVILTRSSKWTKLRAWGRKIMKRSGLKKAAAAVARKLAVIMLRMWQTGQAFVWGDKKKHDKTAGAAA